MHTLLSPKEIMMNLAQSKMLVLPQGSRLIISDRVPHYQDKEMRGFWDDPQVSKN
jgi:hypothetical protein